MFLQQYTRFIAVLIFTVGQSRQVSTGFSGYVKTLKSYFNYEEPEAEVGEFSQKIPYEVSTVDEKFISEAVKLTGVALSELDSCQQRVVLKLRSDCDKMNDEQLAKMAVHLLNCQSYIEGRPIFPCTDDMSIRDCTVSMDSDTWTSYHLMSNRARAVCYSIRQIQFRGLAEHTVNRLMDAANNQLSALGIIAKKQENLQDLAEHTLGALSKGHNLLVNQQKDIQKAQFYGQLALEDNLKKLSMEKALIIDTHNELIEMTSQIQKELEDSSKNLDQQADESRKNHEKLMDDLLAIQSKAHAIFDRIDESSKLLLEQNENFKLQYQETLRNLAEVNKTVHNLVTLVGGTREALEERLQWLTAALGGTDMAVERLYLIIWHAAFMLVSMLTCAFLSARLTTRVMVATLPPLNLAIALWGNKNQMGPISLVAVIMAFVLGQFILLWAVTFKTQIRGALTWKQRHSTSPNYEKIPERAKDFNFSEKTSSSLDDDELLDDFNMLGSPTPPLSRSEFYNRSTRSRSSTPLVVNGSSRGICHAKTKVGTPCKLASLPGRANCHRHQAGDSIAG